MLILFVAERKITGQVHIFPVDLEIKGKIIEGKETERLTDKQC